MNKVILFGLLVLIASPAFATDPLLVEFGWDQPNPVTLPANYATLVSSTPWDGVWGYDTITAFPSIRTAPPSAVDFWNVHCTGFCSVGFANGGQQPFGNLGGQIALDQLLGGVNFLWSDGWDGYQTPYANNPSLVGTFHAATYVPQRGEGLYGYKITTVEREVNAAGQMVRVYGVFDPLPEPPALLLALVGCVALLTRKRG